MKDLIEALTILLKYGDPRRPTGCDHDILYINDEVDVTKVSAEDLAQLEELGFSVEEGQFVSHRFGSM